MFTCNFTTKFKRDYKRVLKRGWDMNLFENVYDLLAEKGELPQNYKSHALTGNWIGYIDAHIQPNWVLIYNCPNCPYCPYCPNYLFCVLLLQ